MRNDSVLMFRNASIQSEKDDVKHTNSKKKMMPLD